MPIILADPTKGTSVSDEFIKNEGIKTSYVIGGETVISNAVSSKLPGAKRLGGIDRNETNAKVVSEFYKGTDLKNAYVAKDGMKNKDQLIDALAVGVLAAKNQSPVILVSNKLSTPQKEVLNTKSLDKVTQVGGNGNEAAFNELKTLQAKITHTAKTVAELKSAVDKADANDVVNFNPGGTVSENITIATKNAISVNLSGTYKGTVTINMPNGDVTNNGTMDKVIVDDIKVGTFTNNGKITNLTVNDNNGGKIVNGKDGKIDKIEVPSGAKAVAIENKGTVSTIKNDSKDTVLNNEGKVDKVEGNEKPSTEGNRPGGGSGGGGSSSGGSGSHEVSVSEVSVIANGNIESVVKGGTLQFTAIVNPNNATNKSVTWSVTNQDNSAVAEGTTISNTGLLVVSNGETATSLKVTATSVYDKTKKGTVSVAVSEAPVVTEADVNDLEGLTAALADKNIKTINITADILNIDKSIEVNREVAINGSGHTLEFTGLEKAEGTVDDGLILYENATVKNLVVDAGLSTPATWGGTYAIHVYGAEVTLENVTAKGGNGGILVNGSNVTLKGNIDVSGNGFGGIEVSKGDGLANNSKLTVTGSTLVNEDEAYKLPTVWVINGQGEVAGREFTTNTTIKPEQTQYYLVAANAEAPVVTEKDVQDLEGLTAALADKNIKTINITADILNIDKSIEVNREVAINGSGHTLEFTGLEKAEGTVDDGLILYENATVKNLVVDAGLSTPATWGGTYAIHVYGAEVTLENVTAKGGNGGILVNGSNVTLKGNIDVSGNGFGGIEVSKGDGLANNSKLTVTGSTLVNEDEAYKLPTVWVINGQGEVAGREFTTNTTIKPEQTQYYLVAANAEAPVVTEADTKSDLIKL